MAVRCPIDRGRYVDGLRHRHTVIMSILIMTESEPGVLVMDGALVLFLFSSHILVTRCICCLLYTSDAADE